MGKSTILDSKFSNNEDSISQTSLDDMQQRLEIKNLACDFYKNKTEKLEATLKNTKNFLNMVIHDFRNPTT